MVLFQTVLKFICLLQGCNYIACLPIQLPSETILENYKIVYLPFDIKYVPVDTTVDLKNSIAQSKKHTFIENEVLEESNEKVDDSDTQKPNNKLKDKKNNAKELLLVPLSTILKQKSNSFDTPIPLRKLKQLPKDLVLVPVTEADKESENDSEDSSVGSLETIKASSGLSRKVKRQAPSRVVLRPIVRYRRISTPLVGYLRDGDAFPTVA